MKTMTNQRLKAPPGPREERERMNGLLNVHEAAAMLRVEVATVYQWKYQGRLPFVKLGRTLRFKQSAIQKLIDENERPAVRA